MNVLCQSEKQLGQNLTLAMRLEEHARYAFVGLLLVWRYMGYGRVHCARTWVDLDVEMRAFGKGRNVVECREGGVPVEYARPAEPQVTWCRPDESMHVKGRAMDLLLGDYAEEIQEQLEGVARRMGFTLGVDREVKCAGHFEWRGGLDE